MNKTQRDFLKECKHELNSIKETLLFNMIYILPTTEKDKYSGCREMYIIGETEKKRKIFINHTK